MRYCPLLFVLAFLALILGTACAETPPEVGPPGDLGRVTCQGDGFRIDLLDALDALPEAAPAAHREQLRDWVWTALLARLAERSSKVGLLKAVAAQPLFRDDSLAGVLDFPAGRSRSVAAPDGTVVVLVERSSPERVRDDALEAVDRATLPLGEMPIRAEIYAVDFRMETGFADLCRLAAWDREWLRSSEAGFRHRRIRTAGELDGFLAGGVDLLSARWIAEDSGGALEVTGRQRARTRSSPLTPEHVAALMRVPDELRQHARRFADQVDHALRAGAQLAAEDAETQRFLDRALALIEQYPGMPTEELVLALELERGLSEELGFSLDPRSDVDDARARLGELVAALEEPTGLVGLLRSWETAPEDALRLAVNATAGGSLQRTRATLAGLRAQLGRVDDHTGEGLLLQAEGRAGDPIAAELVQATLQRSRYQCARYDGPLEGSAAGMTMFYTDLLAKLWAMDYGRSAPSDAVPGFVSVTQHRLSTVYCHGDEGRPHTRIWFGVGEEGYTRDPAHGLRFAPNATRIFARGSALGPDHSDEVEPTADMARFIRWWNRHYPEVAEWEPQYELLNQLMKWTLVRRLAEISGIPGCLPLAEDLAPDRPWRFDRWHEHQREALRWQAPVTLLPRADEETECLPLFESERFEQCGGLARLSGGVSLPGRTAVTRQSAGEASQRRTRRRLAIRTSDQAVLASAQIPGDVPLRGTNWHSRASGRSRTYSKEVALQGGGFEGRQRFDGFGVGRLRGEDLKSGAVTLRAERGERSQLIRLATDAIERMAGGNETLADAVRSVAGELPVLPLPDGRILVRFEPRDGESAVYGVLSSGGGIRGPPEGMHVTVGIPASRTADRGPGRIDLLVLREEQAASFLEDAADRPWSEPDPILQLAREDPAAAHEELIRSEAPASRVAKVASEAARHGDLRISKDLVDRLVDSPEFASSSDLHNAARAVHRARMEAARRDDAAAQDRRATLGEMHLRLALAESRLLNAPNALAEGAVRQAKSIYAPLHFPKEEMLPAVGHLPGRPLPVSERFVLEVLDVSLRPSEAPSRFEFRGLEFRRIPNPARLPRQEPSRPIAPSSPAVSAAVVPCRTEVSDEATAEAIASWIPDCYRRISGGSSSSEAAEETWIAAAALLACDLDGDGRVASDDEERCILSVLRDYEAALGPYVAR